MSAFRVGQLFSATATGAMTSMVSATPGKKAIHAVLTGTGALTCTLQIRVSNTGSNPIVLATITLSGTTSAADGFAYDAAWAEMDVNVTALTGTGAKITVTITEVP